MSEFFVALLVVALYVGAVLLIARVAGFNEGEDRS